MITEQFWDVVKRKINSDSIFNAPKMKSPQMYDEERSAQQEEEGTMSLINNTLSRQKKNPKQCENNDNEQPQNQEIEAVIITATDDEYAVAKKAFSCTESNSIDNGIVSCNAKYVSNGREYDIVIVRQRGMGLSSAAMATTLSIMKWKPKIVIMCGVCAGVSDKTSIGDVVVFSSVYDYGSGKYIDGEFMPDANQWQIDSSVLSLVEAMRLDAFVRREIQDSWTNNTGKPNTEMQIHVLPACSGAAVIADGGKVAALKKNQRSIGAIDMESYAVAYVSCSILQSRLWLVVKGVQDFANSEKNDSYREYAAFVSAMFVKKFQEKF